MAQQNAKDRDCRSSVDADGPDQDVEPTGKVSQVAADFAEAVTKLALEGDWFLAARQNYLLASFNLREKSR